ncbi:MAG TPA: hypothetical protein VK590_05015 [Saprospiraceae bacterium]|nr:hypothetical protein [Saprospiraceae bacterium]
MIKRFFLLTVLLTIAQLTFGQNSADSSGTRTDIKAYYTLQECEKNDSLCREENKLLQANVKLYKSKYDKQVSYSDSLKFVNNELAGDMKNVVVNCQRDLKRKEFWGSFFKYTTLVTVPVAIVEGMIIYIKK